jgi:hypothetical protein
LVCMLECINDSRHWSNSLSCGKHRVEATNKSQI